MNDDIKQAKLKKFVADRDMEVAVYETIRDVFLKIKIGQDVHVLAAERLALNSLKEAWKELEKYKEVKSELSTGAKNPGL